MSFSEDNKPFKMFLTHEQSTPTCFTVSKHSLFEKKYIAGTTVQLDYTLFDFKTVPKS